MRFILKRVFALMLTLVLFIGLVPFALAAEPEVPGFPAYPDAVRQGLSYLIPLPYAATTVDMWTLTPDIPAGFEYGFYSNAAATVPVNDSVFPATSTLYMKVWETDFAANNAVYSLVFNREPYCANVNRPASVGTDVILSENDFGYYDRDGDRFTGIVFTSLPAPEHAALYVNNVSASNKVVTDNLYTISGPFTVGTFNNLIIRPLTADVTIFFSYYVTDGNFKGSVKTISVTVAPPPVPPAAAPVNINVSNTADYLFKPADFSNNYSVGGYGALKNVIVTSLPAGGGRLMFNGSPVVIGQSIPLAEMISKSFVYQPVSGTVYTDSFTWRGSDGTVSSENAPVNLNVRANTKPTIYTFSKESTSNVQIVFYLSDFRGAYSDADGDSLSYIKITSLPSHGTLTLNSVAVQKNAVITAEQIDTNTLKFIPDANWSGDTSMQWVASDGKNESSASYINIRIKPGNRIPTSSDIIKNIAKNETLNFTLSDFTNVYTDADNNPLYSILITSFPNTSMGYLYDGTKRLTPSDSEYVVLASNLGSLKFKPNTDVTGQAYFTFKVSDGTAYSASPSTVLINVGMSGITVKNNAFYTGINERLYFSLSDFTEVYTSTAALQKITVTSLPSSLGTLYLGSYPVSVGDVIPRSSLSSLSFLPSGRSTGETSFRFTMSSDYATSQVVTFTIYVGAGSYDGSAPYITSLIPNKTLTSSRTVTLSISARDNYYGKPTHMSFAVNGGNYGAWTTYSETHNYTLPNKDGIHTVSVRVRNKDGRISTSKSVWVELDRSAPKILSASISANRRTIHVQFDEPVESVYSLSGVSSRLRLLSGGSSLSLLSHSANISGSTLILSFSSALSGSVNGIRLLADAVKDGAGNALSSETSVTLRDAQSHDRVSYSGGITLVRLNNATSSSRAYTAVLDAMTLNDILGSLSNSSKRLRIQINTGPESPSSLTLIVSESALTSSNAAKINELALFDGSTEVIIDLSEMRNFMEDYLTHPITISLSSGSAGYVSSSQKPYASRQLSITAGDNALPAPWNRNLCKMFLPYPNSDSSLNDMIVLYGPNYDAEYAPLYSSRYVSGRVGATVVRPGVYISAINTVSYNDIGNFTWAYPHIRALSARKIFEGSGTPGRFAPAEALTRGQFIKLLVTSLDLVDPEAVCSFTDVGTGDWEYRFLASAVTAGILDDGGRFYPDLPITREDMALYCYMAAEAAGTVLPVSNPSMTFKDASSISYDKRAAVNAMQRAGILNGYPDTRFDPKGTTLRGAVAKVIYLLMQIKYDI